jgi:hypothetical protein
LPGAGLSARLSNPDDGKKRGNDNPQAATNRARNSLRHDFSLADDAWQPQARFKV